MAWAKKSSHKICLWLVSWEPKACRAIHMERGKSNFLLIKERTKVEILFTFRHPAMWIDAIKAQKINFLDLGANHIRSVAAVKWKLDSEVDGGRGRVKIRPLDYWRRGSIFFFILSKLLSILAYLCCTIASYGDYVLLFITHPYVSIMFIWNSWASNLSM